MPTLPRPENAATWLSELVIARQGVLVVQVWPLVQVVHGVHFHTSFVISRSCSMAPTVITFLAVPGERTVSGSPLSPELSPPAPLPAGNTNNNGCDPVTPGSASRTAAS